MASKLDVRDVMTIRHGSTTVQRYEPGGFGRPKSTI
jgi:hypothetical protein